MIKKIKSTNIYEIRYIDNETGSEKILFRKSLSNGKVWKIEKFIYLGTTKITFTTTYAGKSISKRMDVKNGWNNFYVSQDEWQDGICSLEERWNLSIHEKITNIRQWVTR